MNKVIEGKVNKSRTACGSFLTFFGFFTFFDHAFLAILLTTSDFNIAIISE
ncbi:MAG: hypothetical protein Q7V19_01980 [Bacteroidales bacterium]|nr:hypothetical protein [Bacteroidales bacterium]